MIVRDNVIFSEPGKVLRRKSDGEIVGDEYALGYIYYLGGKKLDVPRLEVPSDFEDAESPEDARYAELVESYIRKEYSLSNELAIQRQRDSKPEQFKKYFDFCEECKKRAREELNM